MCCDDLAGQVSPGGEKACIYSFDPCCDHWAETNPVVPDSEVLLSI